MKYSRSNFIKTLASIGVFAQLPLILHSCNNDYIINNKELPKYDKISSDYLLIIRDVQNILFPADLNGPSASDVNAEFLFVNTLNDSRRDPDENQYLINGIKWLEESSVEAFGKPFLKLKTRQKKNLINSLSKISWGRTWLSVNISIIIEALLSDPIYGYNKDGVGWKWLDHKTGYPRPSEALMYDQIFETLDF